MRLIECSRVILKHVTYYEWLMIWPVRWSSQITGLVIDLDALFKGRLCCFPKDPLEDVETWGESVDKVLSCKGESLFWLYTLVDCIYAVHLAAYCPLWFPAGQIAFREFLKSEYSEENILFWLACEDYKKIKTVPEMISSANRIYSEFVQTEAPKQGKKKKKTQHIINIINKNNKLQL